MQDCDSSALDLTETPADEALATRRRSNRRAPWGFARRSRRSNCASISVSRGTRQSEPDRTAA